MDGNKINGQEVTRELLEQKGYKRYRGENIDIYYDKNICAHIGNCVRGNPEIFEVGRRPWIIPDNGSEKNAAFVVDTCPSGALKYIFRKEDA
ncbi:hypothetical protein NRIC_12720 [Enterococcus florum]|uniref:Divergent 4Fe-4S mono-cluster domain-containing protein n=1 Tax=Enterococcus florum TaxID=2480627 RepID=A0A4P5PAU6_9ENTE|nr:(4Fe-4S)-binding protein [Enterococcus florum]GCF93381.1 hypothetical protein NRIC_12720 [Enterococcus florum]